VTDRPADDVQPSRPEGDTTVDPVANARLRVAEARASKSLFELIPRRDLTKAVLLVVILVIVIALQRRSGSIVKNLTRDLSNPPTRVEPKGPPRVRLQAPPSPSPPPLSPAAP
jgi:hypothetical protein